MHVTEVEKCAIISIFTDRDFACAFIGWHVNFTVVVAIDEKDDD